MIDARLAPYGIFVSRVALGLMFIAHALLKYVVFTIPGFAAFLGQAGFPEVLAWPTVLAELLGGVAIVLGVYSRVVALALIPVLVGALLRARAERLALHRRERRLGISRVPRRRRRLARADRRGRLRPEADGPARGRGLRLQGRLSGPLSPENLTSPDGISDAVLFRNGDTDDQGSGPVLLKLRSHRDDGLRGRRRRARGRGRGGGEAGAGDGAGGDRQGEPLQARPARARCDAAGTRRVRRRDRRRADAVRAHGLADGGLLGRAGALWASGALVGKVGGAFSSTATQHGGQETTLFSAITNLLHFGFVIVGLPYAFQEQMTLDEIVGGAPYGATTIAGSQGQRQPSEKDLAGARYQGRHIAQIAAKLAG